MLPDVPILANPAGDGNESRPGCPARDDGRRDHRRHPVHVSRPRPRHADIEGFIAADLKNPFQRGRGGPGGWWILIEPGIEVEGSPEVVPDVAGWRRGRMPELPSEPPIAVVPDWGCEIL
jgi:hypothetical protein